MILATNNQNKVKQFNGLFKNVHFLTLKDIKFETEIIENGKTFSQNALIKARAIYKATKCAVLSDDSGFMVECLNDFPGVNTHRFLGPLKSSDDRNDYILEKLKNVPYENRNCKIVCALALITKSGKEFVVEGVLNKKILFEKKGDNKFGFDEIIEMLPGISAAQLTDDEKNKISARFIAKNELISVLEKQGLTIGKGDLE